MFYGIIYSRHIWELVQLTLLKPQGLKTIEGDANLSPLILNSEYKHLINY